MRGVFEEVWGREPEVAAVHAGLECGLLGDKVPGLEKLTWPAFLFENLIPVTIGNIIGGAVLVAAIYWAIYLRPNQAAT